MAYFSSSSPLRKGQVVSVHVLVLSIIATAVFLFLLRSFFDSSPVPTQSCACPTAGDGVVRVSGERISSKAEDVEWAKAQIELNYLHIQDNCLWKGINHRTREQQLRDLIQFKGISHYEGEESKNHTAFPCSGELLVEQHHSNYDEPWAGGRDVYEFLAGQLS